MKLSVCSNGNHQHESLLNKRISARIPTEFCDGGMHIDLRVDPALGEAESYLVKQTADGWRITGSDELGLYFGIGKFLHCAKWNGDDFIPMETDGVITPACDFRAIYFAVHFYNWYQNAPAEELEAYLEDLLLWGYNAIICICPIINIMDFEDPLFFECVEKARKMFRVAQKLGMKKGLILDNNQGMKSSPHALDADLSFDPVGRRGTIGRNLCLSKPGAMEHMRLIYDAQLKQYTDVRLEYIISWPYDEGGCGCQDCRPWGARKYLDSCKVIREVAQQYYPEAKFIVSTWLFDTPTDEGEFAGFYERLQTDMSWVDYIMCDAHAEFPRYPLVHTPIKPIVNFPEISMWKLYPWGGYGANPMPRRFQEIWNEVKHMASGGMPYSEGMYEDISKVQCVGYYWDPNREWSDILSEYICYEFDAAACSDILEMICCIESNHVATGNVHQPDLDLALRAGRLARDVDARLSERANNNWRWRILYIRAILDEKRHRYYFEHNMQGEEDLWILRNYSGVFLAKDAEAQMLFRELRRLYHCVPFNGENSWTLPPLNGCTVIG